MKPLKLYRCIYCGRTVAAQSEPECKCLYGKEGSMAKTMEEFVSDELWQARDLVKKTRLARRLVKEMLPSFVTIGPQDNKIMSLHEAFNQLISNLEKRINNMNRALNRYSADKQARERKKYENA